MNKHIELVKKWLNNPDSVTVEELKANVDAAYTARFYAAAYTAYTVANAAANAAYAAYAAADVASDAADAAYDAANAAYDDVDNAAAYDAAAYAAYFVKKYEKLTEGCMNDTRY